MTTRNRYSGHCWRCGKTCAPGKGLMGRASAGKWVMEHETCARRAGAVASSLQPRPVVMRERADLDA